MRTRSQDQSLSSYVEKHCCEYHWQPLEHYTDSNSVKRETLTALLETLSGCVLGIFDLSISPGPFLLSFGDLMYYRPVAGADKMFASKLVSRLILFC